MRATASILGTALMICSFGCSPEITSGTYFCGPERLCPPDFECDDPTFTCENPIVAAPFSCPDGSQSAEPDELVTMARDLGETTCGDQIANALTGCIVDINDVDHFEFDYLTECTGADPRLSVVIKFAIAHAALTLEVVDDSENVVATGELCTPSGDFTGREWLCLEFLPPTGTYFVRIRSDRDSPDCDGGCHYNQYQLSVSLPLA
jgi:hypothetical protein